MRSAGAGTPGRRPRKPARRRRSLGAAAAGGLGGGALAARAVRRCRGALGGGPMARRPVGWSAAGRGVRRRPVLRRAGLACVDKVQRRCWLQQAWWFGGARAQVQIWPLRFGFSRWMPGRRPRDGWLSAWCCGGWPWSSDLAPSCISAGAGCGGRGRWSLRCFSIRVPGCCSLRWRLMLGTRACRVLGGVLEFRAKALALTLSVPAAAAHSSCRLPCWRRWPWSSIHTLMGFASPGEILAPISRAGDGVGYVATFLEASSRKACSVAGLWFSHRRIGGCRGGGSE